MMKILKKTSKNMLIQVKYMAQHAHAIKINLPTDVGAAISTFAGNSASGTESVSGPGSTVNFGGTSAFPYMRPKDHGGRFCATDVARTRHYGRRNELTGRRNEIRLASRSAATYVTLGFPPLLTSSAPLNKLAL